MRTDNGFAKRTFIGKAPGSTTLSQPDDYSHAAAYREYVHAREATMDYLIRVAPDVRSLLTPAQKRRLPSFILNYLDDCVLKFIRSSSVGDGGNLFIR